MIYHFIVNAKSRSGMGGMTWKLIEPELKKRRTEYICHLTEKRGHAKKIAAQITEDGQNHTLVVMGGDGTVNEVVNGIKDPSKVLFGYIPVGSSNDFARGLRLEKDPMKALNVILKPVKTMQIDLGEIRNKTGSRRFAVSAGIGFDAAVCHEVCVSKWKVLLNRIGLGKLSYAAVALDRLRKDRPARIRVSLSDGSERIFENTYFAAFMNLPYEGGGFKFCPDASPEDGCLDIIVVHGITLPGILFLLPLAFAGKHVGFRGISFMKCTEAYIEADVPLPLHTDGEPGFLRKELSVRFTDMRLNVIAG